MSFQIGDKIVYPNQGVGIIEQISRRNLTGQAETFYLLKLASNGMRVMVPMTNVENVGLRRVAKNREIGNVLDYLNRGVCKAPYDWYGRFIASSERLRTCALPKIAEVFWTTLVARQC